ncbi:hypothetical protein D3C86_2135350 [compost metagenome]
MVIAPSVTEARLATSLVALKSAVAVMPFEPASQVSFTPPASWMHTETAVLIESAAVIALAILALAV